MLAPEVGQVSHEAGPNLLLPVLALRDQSLFPEASLALLVGLPQVKVVEAASRTGRRLLALAQKDASAAIPTARDLLGVGTIAELTEDLAAADGTHRIELDGIRRARVVDVIGNQVLIAEVEPIEDGDPGDEWGPAVESLARYLHSHPDLRAFLDERRRSGGPMAWVNLACQHLPIAASARQKLLESDASARCLKISRGLDALLRKEKGD